jgi:hypothetical protein
MRHSILVASLEATLGSVREKPNDLAAQRLQPLALVFLAAVALDGLLLPVSGAEQLNALRSKRHPTHDLAQRRVLSWTGPRGAFRVRQKQVPQPGSARPGLQLL